MKKIRWILLLISVLGFAQEVKEETVKVTDTTAVVPKIFWENSNKFGVDFNETAFVNWNAGGINSVSGLVKLNLVRNYSRERGKWDNEFVFRYGSNWQDGTGIRKTDDLIQLNSTYGYKTAEDTNWYYTTKFTFTTQANKGFKYPDVSKEVSDFLAPAYIVFGIGSEYSLKEKKFSAYMSPLSSKTTLVMSQKLANEGAFGVEKGKNVRTELGAYVNLAWKNEILKNVIMENRLALFSDYLNKFGNVDVNWELKLDLVVNKYIRANIFTHLIYDDDVKATKDVNGISVTIGPKVQLKQMLGVGFAYEF